MYEQDKVHINLRFVIELFTVFRLHLNLGLMQKIASHIIKVHASGATTTKSTDVAEGENWLKRYLFFSESIFFIVFHIHEAWMSS